MKKKDMWSQESKKENTSIKVFSSSLKSYPKKQSEQVRSSFLTEIPL